MKIETISHSMNKYNEDTLIVLDDLYMVIDGATGIGNKIIDTPMTDAAWFVTEFKSQFIHRYERHKDFYDVFDKALFATKDLYSELALTDKPEVYEIPSFVFIAVKLNDQHATFYYSGDCKAFVKTSTESFTVGKSHLEVLDAQTSELMASLPTHLAIEEKRELVIPHLREKRSLANQPNGYNVVNTSNFKIENIDEETINIDNIQQLLLATDGFYCLQSEYNKTSPEGFFNLIHLGGLENCLSNLRKIEKDPEAEINRFKRHDDSTAIHIQM